METKLKPLLNPKPPLYSHFTIYRWNIMQLSSHILGLIIYMLFWQSDKGHLYM